jgi:hypothetical protein
LTSAELVVAGEPPIPEEGLSLAKVAGIPVGVLLGSETPCASTVAGDTPNVMVDAALLSWFCSCLGGIPGAAGVVVEEVAVAAVSHVWATF